MYGRSAYQAQATTTASPAQLVLMLYDGALTQIARADEALGEDGDAEAAHQALSKAQTIVTELAVTLDHERGGEVAANLASLYEYCTHLLVEANISKSPAGLGDAANVLRGLRDAWEQACCNAPVGVAG
jgi:flagellar secretion chaperone FliS